MRIRGKAYKEIYRIIEHSEKKIKDKIPKKFMNVIEMTMSKEYEPNIDYNISINEQKLMPETFAIMAVIYRDFICSKEKRDILLEDEKNKIEKIEQQKRELYNPDNIFIKRNKQNIDEINKTNETNIIEYKEKIFRKILNKLKRLFKIHR